MEAVYLGNLLVFYLSISLLAIGLWKPSVVLWWMSYQNRLKVLKYYGIAAAVSGFIWWLLSIYSST